MKFNTKVELSFWLGWQGFAIISYYFGFLGVTAFGLFLPIYTFVGLFLAFLPFAIINAKKKLNDVEVKKIKEQVEREYEFQVYLNNRKFSGNYEFGGWAEQ